MHAQDIHVHAQDIPVFRLCILYFRKLTYIDNPNFIIVLLSACQWNAEYFHLSFWSKKKLHPYPKQLNLPLSVNSLSIAYHTRAETCLPHSLFYFLFFFLLDSNTFMYEEKSLKVMCCINMTTCVSSQVGDKDLLAITNHLYYRQALLLSFCIFYMKLLKLIPE